MRRTCLGDNPCPIARSLDVIGDWWSLLIVRDALAGKRRFNEFQQSLGTPRNVLSARLKALVAHGVLAVEPAGARQDYVPTEKALALAPVLDSLAAWGRAHLCADGRAAVQE